MPSAILAAMLKALRYTLAAIFLAASVGCLALWWRSMNAPKVFDWDAYSSNQRLTLMASDGTCILYTSPRTTIHVGMTTNEALRAAVVEFAIRRRVIGEFGRYDNTVYFPLWYPALVFALAAVGILRIGRFTIRSALIATTIAAGLLGMVVAL